MPPLIVNGVQAKLFDEPRSGIVPAAWTETGLLANAAMAMQAAPARITHDRTLHAREPSSIPDAKNGIMCFPPQPIRKLSVAQPSARENAPLVAAGRWP